MSDAAKQEAHAPIRRRVMGVTGTRAEFGLLVPVFRAIAAHPNLELLVVAAGAHHLAPVRTVREVAAAFQVVAEIPMQQDGVVGRIADAKAFARGAEGFARTIDALRPDVVMVLGDRIEAFAAASTAAIAGVRVAHLHGGDRAEGVADESMRHATSKLAHCHLVASEASAERLRRMGEDDERIHVVGSPAIDDLAEMHPLDDASYTELGRPEIVVALHPTGRPDAEEERCATLLLDACRRRGRTLVVDPNADPGRAGIARAIASSGMLRIAHLPRASWIGLLRRVRVLAGNSSAGLIEAAALRVRTLNVGPRQAGRERGGNVVDIEVWSETAIHEGLERAWRLPEPPSTHPFGDARCGRRCAALLGSTSFDRLTVTKRNRY